MSNIPTPEDAQLFAQSVRKWQQILSLCDWRIEKGSKPAKEAMASVEFNQTARLATYRLGDFVKSVFNVHLRSHTTWIPVLLDNQDQTLVSDTLHWLL